MAPNRTPAPQPVPVPRPIGSEEAVDSYQFSENLFIWLARLTSSDPRHPFSEDEIRRSYCILKILDFLWFEKILPDNPDGAFYVFVNPMRLAELPPDGTEEIAHLSKDCLQYICRRLERPKWTEDKRPSFATSTNKIIRDGKYRR
jgi:hypothetical protein